MSKQGGMVSRNHSRSLPLPQQLLPVPVPKTQKGRESDHTQLSPFQYCSLAQMAKKTDQIRWRGAAGIAHTLAGSCLPARSQKKLLVSLSLRLTSAFFSFFTSLSMFLSLSVLSSWLRTKDILRDFISWGLTRSWIFS